jgi:hypothetical protein
LLAFNFVLKFPLNLLGLWNCSPEFIYSSGYYFLKKLELLRTWFFPDSQLSDRQAKTLY